MKTKQNLSTRKWNSVAQEWSEVTGEERNEIVFEHLNKLYGAYEIRTNYERVLVKASFYTGLSILIICTVMLLLRAKPVTEITSPVYDTLSFHNLEKEKEKIFMEKHPPSNPEPPGSLQDLMPVVGRDSTPEIDSLPTLPPDPNALHGHSNDTVNRYIPNLIGGNFGNEKKGNDGIDSTFDGIFLEEPPTFPGGDDALRAFLKNNVIFPVYVKEVGGSGIVGVSFIVDKEGNITGVDAAKKTRYPELDHEAIRVVKKFPKWNPGKQQGNPVKVRMILPIRFELKR